MTRKKHPIEQVLARYDLVGLIRDMHEQADEKGELAEDIVGWFARKLGEKRRGQ